MIRWNTKTIVSFLAAVDRSINAPFSILLRSLRLSLTVKHISQDKSQLSTRMTLGELMHLVFAVILRWCRSPSYDKQVQHGRWDDVY